MKAKLAADSKRETAPSVCTCVNLRRASRAITRIYDNALEPSNLKITQYSVLANILRSGPVSISNLSRILNLDRTTLVRNLKALETAGYVDNAASLDPRERLVAVSETGRRAAETAFPYWQGAQKRIRDHLGKEHLEQLGSLVTALEEMSDTLGMDRVDR
jgi:DNA-binding MarR family transcriptional regulator